MTSNSQETKRFSPSSPSVFTGEVANKESRILLTGGLALNRTFASLHYRNYRLFWIGNLAVMMGVWMQGLTLGWMVTSLTDSEFDLGLLGFVIGIPQFLFSFVGGMAADHFDRHKLLIVNWAATIILVLILAALAALNWVKFWHVLLIAFLLGTVSAVKIPTFQALIVHLVPRAALPNAIGIHFVGLNSTRVVGPLIAGPLIVAFGIASTFIVQAIGNGFAILLALRMRLQEGVTPDSMSHRLQVKELLNYVTGDKVVPTLLIMEAIPVVFAVPYTIFLPVFARDIFGMDAIGLALLSTAVGVGAALGAGTVSWMGDSRWKGKIMLASGLTLGIALIMLGISRWIWLSLVSLFVAGWATGIYFPMNNTLLHFQVPDQLRGRAISLLAMIWGLMPFGSLAMGALAEITGLKIAVATGGSIIILLFGVVAVFNPTLLKL